MRDIQLSPCILTSYYALLQQTVLTNFVLKAGDIKSGLFAYAMAFTSPCSFCFLSGMFQVNFSCFSSSYVFNKTRILKKPYKFVTNIFVNFTIFVFGMHFWKKGLSVFLSRRYYLGC